MTTGRERALEIALIGVLSAADQQDIGLGGLAERAKQLISLYPREDLNADNRVASAVGELDSALAKIEESKRLSSSGV